METLRNNLRIARKFKNWSLQAAEATTGIKSVTIGSYERGYRLPPLNTLQKLAVDYGVTIGWLMGEECPKCSQEVKIADLEAEIETLKESQSL